MKREETDDEEDDVTKAEKEKHREETEREGAEKEKKFLESGNTVNRERKKIDMANLRVTTLKNNPRLIEPRPAMNNEEIKIQAQKQGVVEDAKRIVKVKEVCGFSCSPSVPDVEGPQEV